MKKLLFLLLFPFLALGQMVPADSTVRALIQSKIPTRGARTTGYSAADVRTAMDGIIDYVNKKNPIVTPEMFGALGNGTTDDTQAWQKLLNWVALSSKGAEIYAPGKYFITSSLIQVNATVRGAGLRIRGAGREKSGFITHNLNGPLFLLDGNNDNIPNNTTYYNTYRTELSDFFIKKSANTVTGTVTGILLSSQKDFYIHDLYMPALSGDGIKITAVGFSDFGESSNGLIERCWIDGLNGKGINIVGDVSSEFVASHIIIRHNSIFYCNTGIYSELSEQVEIDNNQIIGNTNYGIVIGYDGRGVSRLITITHNELGNNNLLGSIWIQAVVTGVVEGNRFVNNLTETFGNQLTTGKADGSGPVRNLTIQRNYIVQANPNLAGHYQFFIHPGYSNNISILDNYKIVLASGGFTMIFHGSTFYAKSTKKAD
ncbi:right-handed parallel beta-helix repeat-containing protein [Salmonirosea aquatica]|uniref:Rhamnogalacturonase A/B/Epimerase-like pectate lyase domain-containing protein n=1 Tax=Salmonirosea aquatica TaxID=2654236 RepID=A0A7C9FFY8_9BACT|nr:hypothetical protein [Cytophagaceae bacterium SJW1-29]